MPFAVIGTALGTVGTALSAGIGAAGGAMAVAGSVATLATYAGIAMSVVGAVTGDKELMQIGGIVGVAGGVGSMATGASLLPTATAETAKTAANTTQSLTNAATPSASMSSIPSSVSAPQLSGSSLIGGKSLSLANTGVGQIDNAVNSAAIISKGPGANSFNLSSLLTPTNLVHIGAVGLTAMANQSNQDRTHELEKSKFNAEQNAANLNRENANTQGRLSMKVIKPELTPMAEKKVIK